MGGPSQFLVQLSTMMIVRSRIELGRRCIAAFADVRQTKPNFGRFFPSGLAIDPALALAKTGLDARRQARVPRFDPYIASGFAPDEPCLTRALSQLINPLGTHGFGPLLLKALVCAVSTPTNDKIADAVVSAIEHGDGRGTVVREPYGDRSNKIDIVVFGRGYIVAIENKKRGGGEGFNQTPRYSAILDRIAVRAGGVPCVAVYLSPEGANPADEKFRPLRVPDLVSAMGEALEHPPMTAGADSILLARAFLLTYLRIC